MGRVKRRRTVRWRVRRIDRGMGKDGGGGARRRKKQQEKTEELELEDKK